MCVSRGRGVQLDNRAREGRKDYRMPRCDTCNRLRASADVRKLPGRTAHRCKDKFDCLLAESNRDPWTVTFAITYPAKDEKEAQEIAKGIEVKPFPITIISVQNVRAAPARAAR